MDLQKSIDHVSLRSTEEIEPNNCPKRGVDRGWVVVLGTGIRGRPVGAIMVGGGVNCKGGAVVRGDFSDIPN